MTTLPLDPIHPAYAVDEEAEHYLGLLAAARQTAAIIVDRPPANHAGMAGYIYQAACELLDAVPADAPGRTVAGGAIYECLERLASAWPELMDGRLQGERVVSGDPRLWKRAMTEWPMGGFAQMAADLLIEHQLLGGAALELGAGVGSCSHLVRDYVSDGYIRSDLQTFLLKRQIIPGTVAAYDFNEPGAWRDLDTIFAANALHCARDKVATLRHLHEMLRDGGALVIAEGNPRTDVRGTPWALNTFFGLFRGWWDVGGFVARQDWQAALHTAGFRGTGHAVRRAGDHDLGGLVWAVK